jgi:hypothetical protein
VKFLVLIVKLIPPSPNQHVFLVLNFFKLEILTGKKMEKNNANSRKNVNNKKLAKNLGSEIWKKNVTPN